MSLLFTPSNLGQLRIKNRFIFSACEDNLATDTGMVTDKLLKKIINLAKGEIGLIISSHMSVHHLGRTRKYQLGLYDDSMISGLKKLTEAVHEHDGTMIFQLGHAGSQAPGDVIGHSPLSPSGDNAMDENSIHEVIRAFSLSAGRALEAGADGIQLHAAHGYLINQFLSPYFNRREDSWGGSAENRFRFLKEIITGVKKILPEGTPLLVKLNSNDYTPLEGITPPLAVIYAKNMADLKIDGLEVSCGTSTLSPWNMCRGDVPVQELLRIVEEPKRSRFESSLKKIEKGFKLEGPYNLDAAKMIKPVFRGIPLFPVGGWRDRSLMEDALNSGHTDFISLCRPFIREPSLVKKIQSGDADSATCKNCNKCLAAVANNMPVRCYYNGFPD